MIENNSYTNEAVEGVFNEIATSNRQAQAKMDEIQKGSAYLDYSVEARRRMANEHRETSYQTFQELQNKYSATVESERVRLHENAFGIGKGWAYFGMNQNEMTQLRALYTNVLNQASDMSNQQLGKAMENAILANDAVSAKAFAAVGYQKQVADVVEMYAAKFGQEAVQALLQFEVVYGNRRSANKKFADHTRISRPF